MLEAFIDTSPYRSRRRSEIKRMLNDRWASIVSLMDNNVNVRVIGGKRVLTINDNVLIDESKFGKIAMDFAEWYLLNKKLMLRDEGS